MMTDPRMSPVRTPLAAVAICDGDQGTRGSTSLLLIRDAHTDAIGQWLAGRTDESSLSRYGLRQAIRLSRLLQPIRLGAIYSSPLRRARQTAAAIARRQAAAVVTFEPL